jgi:predicted dehydrogenase
MDGGTSEINIGLIGYKFMGRAHSNAYIDVDWFFTTGLTPVRKAVCGRDEAAVGEFARELGWETYETSWERLVERDDIHMVDICTPNNTHRSIALAAARAGKHVLCEKPMALNAREAREMLEAAEGAGIKHMVAFNYRRVPAIALAKQLIEAGRLGRIHHFNAVYYQDWLVDPSSPIVWRHRKDVAGSGAHGDMHAHLVDLARFLVGEFEAVNGTAEIFVKERPLADGGMGAVTADDATYFLARFCDGALGSFLATRFATGRKNFLRLEIFGGRGSLVFNLERLNELQFYSREDGENERGFRTILVTEPIHPYISTWWPPGHIIGWEHTFIHEVADFLSCIRRDQLPSPNFHDGLRCHQVLDAVARSAMEGRWQEPGVES